MDERSTEARLADLAPGKFLLAASTGGHLAQLVRMSERIDADPSSLWVTFESEQSRSLLKGRRVHFLPYIAPRDWRGVAQASVRIRRILADENFDCAISTGAGIALAVLPTARVHGTRARYIESVSRIKGPSLTGRIMHNLRLVETFTQHDAWAQGRWRKEEPVLADFVRVRRERSIADGLRLFVTLGTIRPYRFDALVDAVVANGPYREVVWQVGETQRTDLPGTVHTYMDAEDFRAAATSADVVITHAGVGTILALLEDGVSPVVVPRRKSRGEHVDDHQMQIFDLLRQLDLGGPVEVDALEMNTLIEAARSETTPRTEHV